MSSILALYYTSCWTVSKIAERIIILMEFLSQVIKYDCYGKTYKLQLLNNWWTKWCIFRGWLHDCNCHAVSKNTKRNKMFPQTCQYITSFNYSFCLVDFGSSFSMLMEMFIFLYECVICNLKIKNI